MADLATLVWLQWTIVGRIVRWWLRSVGYEPGSRSVTERLYGLYLLLLLVPLALVSWSAALNAAQAIGHHLARDPLLQARLVGLVPPVTLALGLAVLGLSPWRSPIHLSPVEIAQVAGAPLSRRAVVAVTFLRRALLLLVPLALASSLVAVAMSGAYSSDARFALGSVLVAVLIMGAGWVLGLVHQFHPRPAVVLLAAVVAIALVLVVPGAALGPGRVLVQLLRSGSPGGLVALGIGDIVVLLGIGAAGSLVRLDELHAPRRRLRLGPARLAPDPSPLAQPGTRVALHLLRRPADALPLLRDLGLTWLGAHILVGAPPILPWFDWVIVTMLLGPRGVTDLLGTDTREPFLRGLIPQSDLQLLVSESWLAGVAVALAAGAAWLASAPAPLRGSGLLAVGLLLALRVACQGVAMGPALAGRTWRPPFAVAVAVTFTPVLALGAAARQPGPALFLAAALTAALTLWIDRRR